MALFTVSCSAFVRPMTDDDALKTLRELTKDGKLPPESVVLQIENFPDNGRKHPLEIAPLQYRHALGFQIIAENQVRAGQRQYLSRNSL